MASQYRSRRGGLSPANADLIQARLDNLSQRLPLAAPRRARLCLGIARPAGRRPPLCDDYDASRYYRDSPQYAERRLTANDEGLSRLRRPLLLQAQRRHDRAHRRGVGGGVIGNLIDGGHNRVAGTLIGGALGALAGKAIDQSNSDVRCR